MNIDPILNFALVEVSTGYNELATTIVLKPGEGLKLPNPSVSGAYNLVWWDSTTFSNPSDDLRVEIIRVTGPAGTGDTKTIIRAQEGTVASTKNTPGKTYKMLLAVTAKTLLDLRLYSDTKISKTTAGEINAMPEKITPVDDDLVLIEDSQAAHAKRRVRRRNLAPPVTDASIIPRHLAYASPGEFMLIANDAAKDVVSSSPAIAKEVLLARGGTIRIRFTLGRVRWGTSVRGRIFRNGVAVGTERTILSGDWSPIEFTEDLSGWMAGDRCQIFTWVSEGVATDASRISNFRIFSSITEVMVNTIV